MKRVGSIDILRGQVMVLMALDHTRDYFFRGSFFRDPLDPRSTTVLLFLTRWITHFCAPVFVFLAGISAALYEEKRGSRGKTSLHLLFRGLFLISLELTLVRFGWTFDLSGSFLMLQVIWAIGVSMIVLSPFIFLPRKTVLSLGILIICSHNLIELQPPGEGLSGYLQRFLLSGGTVSVPGGPLLDFTYPVLPWIGVMLTGYGCGGLFSGNIDPGKRRKVLLPAGTSMVILFAVLRLSGFYGDPDKWTGTVYSFLDTEKYPPSLQFLLMTLGPALIFLGLAERGRGALSRILSRFGRVPLFYYVLHLYLIHFLAMAMLCFRGEDWREMILTAETFRSAALLHYGYSLPVVYLFWLAVILILYPLCLLYGRNVKPLLSRPFRNV